MERRPFAEILANEKLDLKLEYIRLSVIFNATDRDGYSLRELCEKHFLEMPFRGTYLGLDDFEKSNNIAFEIEPENVDINYLVNFCEYIYNLVVHLKERTHFERSKFSNPIEHIQTLIEKIGYMMIQHEDIYLLVPKSQPAIVVSEMLPADLSYKVIEYNHHSMKGNLARKQATLKLLADQLEAKKKELNNLNSSLSGDLFYLLNNLNIRHNNIDPDSKGYKKGVADMSNDELEEWYDKTYDICLYAFMTLDQADRNAKVKALKQKIEDSN